MEKIKHASLNEAMIAAQLELIHPLKIATNPHFKSKYAPLDEVLIPNKPILAKHGLRLSEVLGYHEPGVWGLCISLVHESGARDSAFWPILAKDKPQAIKAEITYARRALIEGLLNIVAEEDNDGNESAPYRPPVQQPKPPLTNYAPQSTPPTKVPPQASQDVPSLDLEWTVSFGKHKDKALKDIGLDVAVNYADYLRRDAREKNKTIQGGAKDFVERVDAWLNYDLEQKTKQLGLVRASVREEYRAKTGEDPLFDQIDKQEARTSELKPPTNLWDIPLE